ncbi:uncharacterized protein LOC34623061 [Cyclospora cayetanensis]|uniref:Uncharacterized protein LOC34623061 n=1 Tax=Cyclospora cayetanensis TaxID=88456 RepID=A0A6P6RT31_9EIME|nr:uncharacterized protein LOC34623061 [Cyclospora cayetanensis]
MRTCERPSQGASPLDTFLYKDTWGEQLLHHSIGRAKFVPDGSAIVCTEIRSAPYRLGLKFCINRQCAILLASGSSGRHLAEALRSKAACHGDPLGSIRPTWLQLSGKEDWAAWGARVCEAPASPREALLRFEVIYTSLTEDCRETRPHFGNTRLRVVTVIRASSLDPWRVEGRRTLLNPNPLADCKHLAGRCVASSEGCSPTESWSSCVAGPLRETETPTGGREVRPFGGFCGFDLPPWRTQGFLLANTFIGCRQTVVAILTDERGQGGLGDDGLEMCGARRAGMCAVCCVAEGPRVRQLQLNKSQGPSTSMEIKMAAAAAAVGDVSLWDVRGEWILVQTSSPVHVPALVLAKLRASASAKESCNEGDLMGSPIVADIVHAMVLRGPHEALDGAVNKLQLHMLTLSLYHLECQRHWLLRLGAPPKGPSLPSLAVFIHGGPHACATCAYSRYVLFLTTIGFDVLVVNYRGSAGFGQDELVSIHGRAGRQDVEDVEEIVSRVVQRFGYNRNRCVVMGGSHGGFLTCHLIGQFPKLFSAASARNPVTYIPAMFASSDIPDFVFPVSCGKDFEFDKPPTEEAIVKMQHLSPTEYVGSIQTPILLALGAKDQRVPPSQGLLFWKLLNGNGKKSKLLWYPEDNHSLDTPVTDADYWTNTASWFLEHVSQEVLPPL